MEQQVHISTLILKYNSVCVCVCVCVRVFENSLIWLTSYVDSPFIYCRLSIVMQNLNNLTDDGDGEIGGFRFIRKRIGSGKNCIKVTLDCFPFFCNLFSTLAPRIFFKGIVHQQCFYILNIIFWIEYGVC